MTKIFVAYSEQPPHLPVAVADSGAELARIMGVNQSTIFNVIGRARRAGTVRRYACVLVDDDGEGTNEEI